MNDNGENWSLWAVSSLGMLLLSEDRGHVLVQAVEIEAEGENLVAISKSPSGRKTILVGEGGHTELFETALNNHLAIFEIDRSNATRVEVDDLMPVIATPMARGNHP
jgi:hypothetical protein